MGVDFDKRCAYPYSANISGSFLQADIQTLDAQTITAAYPQGSIRVLAGCAPCQTFSTLNNKKPDTRTSDSRTYLIQHFERLIEEVQPDYVAMENVPPMKNSQVFKSFVEALGTKNYSVSFSTVNCADYGAPTSRRRVVLLASKHGPIDLIPPTHKDNHISVRQAIGHLPALQHGETDASDRLHICKKLNDLDLKRIQSSKPGGTWKDWPVELVPARFRGRDMYLGVFGRMDPDKAAPTLVTQFFNVKENRMGHYDQDRGISLREGAILQSFPDTFEFVAPDAPVYVSNVARYIGNSVPPKLGEAIGRSIIEHAKAGNLI